MGRGFGVEPEDRADPNTPFENLTRREKFDELLAPLREFGIEHTVEFLWTRNWRKSIATASDRYGCDTIMLCESSAEHKVGLTDSRWELVRQANCDVVIVDEGTTGPIKTTATTLAGPSFAATTPRKTIPTKNPATPATRQPKKYTPVSITGRRQ